MMQPHGVLTAMERYDRGATRRARIAAVVRGLAVLALVLAAVWLLPL